MKIHDTGVGGPVQTTDATATLVTDFDPTAHPAAPDNCILSVQIEAIGRGPSNTGVSLAAAATFSVASGVITILGAQTTVLAAQGSAGLLTCTLTIDAFSNVIRGRVTGVAATTIDWCAYRIVLSTDF